MHIIVMRSDEAPHPTYYQCYDSVWCRAVFGRKKIATRMEPDFAKFVCGQLRALSYDVNVMDESLRFNAKTLGG